MFTSTTPYPENHLAMSEITTIKVFVNGPNKKPREVDNALLVEVSDYFASEAWETRFEKAGLEGSFIPPEEERDVWDIFLTKLETLNSETVRMDFTDALGSPDDDDDDSDEGPELLVRCFKFGIHFRVQGFRDQAFRGLREGKWTLSGNLVKLVWQQTLETLVWVRTLADLVSEPNPEILLLRELTIQRAMHNLKTGALKISEIETFAVPEFQTAFAFALLRSEDQNVINLRRQDERERLWKDWEARRADPRAGGTIHVDYAELEAVWAASAEDERRRRESGGKGKEKEKRYEQRDGGASTFCFWALRK
jgi:hypothetical protein